MSEIRVADADRERAVERLRRAAGEGRLEPEELEQRTEAALRSRTETELAKLVEDLPPERRPSRRRQRKVAGLRDHRLAYAVGAPAMIAIWALTGADYFWPVWPILGWGSGLFFHGRAVAAR
ncbi:MAG: DUF1707 domain-containing protein [Thermoleophilaceae bacterium]|jgi:Domain of unknown function (DUF1707)/2TM domain